MTGLPAFAVIVGAFAAFIAWGFWCQRQLDRADAEAARMHEDVRIALARRDAFTTTVRGQQRVRALRRGKKIKREDGTSLDVQASLLTWSIHDLREAMQAERMRATETRINLDTYDRLARLCESTGCDMVTDALESVGMSLDEYLAAEDVA